MFVSRCADLFHSDPKVRMPLTLPIAAQWVPSLSPLARGEGLCGGRRA
jgi:hypothetical protein